ncbi:hypothetical protein [Deinococcus sonorensis]|uniref:Lipoprotein n=2 Tax=Deinococcus sonorensis TaxID=309891 RepID=A0AAU7U6U4_9DEIO
MKARMMMGAALVLGLGLTACGGNAGSVPPTGTPGTGGGGGGTALPAELQGEWNYGTISPIEYYDPTSGQYAEASGTSDILKFTADGTYERTGITVVTTYNCTSKILLHQTGIVTLSGTTLTLTPKVSLAKGYRCSPSDAFENRALNTSVNTWNVAGSGAQAVLTLGDPDHQAVDSHYNRPRGTSTPGSGGAAGSIKGTLHVAKSGETIGAVSVFACPASGTCAAAGDAFRYTHPGDLGTSGSYVLGNVTNVPHNVFAWTDVNDNNQVDAGDMYGVYTSDGQSVTAVTPPAQGIDITLSKLTPDDVQ